MSNLRPGIQILIDQLASNPEEFFGRLEDATTNTLRLNVIHGKFVNWRSIIESELIPGVRRSEDREVRPNTWFLTDDERVALVEAYTEARRVRFDAEIISALTAEPERVSTAPSGFYAQEVMRLDATGNISVGTVAPSSWGNAVAKREGRSV